MVAGFNGHGAHEIAMVEDAPLGSMHGLAPRSIPTVRTTAEENACKIVRLSRARIMMRSKSDLRAGASSN